MNEAVHDAVDSITCPYCGQMASLRTTLRDGSRYYVCQVCHVDTVLSADERRPWRSSVLEWEAQMKDGSPTMPTVHGTVEMIAKVTRDG